MHQIASGSKPHDSFIFQNPEPIFSGNIFSRPIGFHECRGSGQFEQL
jgi:hypothetical protein